MRHEDSALRRSWLTANTAREGRPSEEQADLTETQTPLASSSRWNTVPFTFCTLGNNRELFMGTFHAPNVTGEALKTAVFTAALFEGFGFDVTPRYDEPRADIIQAVQLREREALCAFIRGIQQGAPVDSFVVPEPSPMPGYDCDVIMASGSFTFGSSIELSADAPLREPFAAWMQGGVNFNSGRLGAILAAQSMLNAGFLKL